VEHEVITFLGAFEAAIKPLPSRIRVLSCEQSQLDAKWRQENLSKFARE
jgi:hypothetical protein